MDIRGQLTSVRLRWLPILATAVLVALVVFGVRASAPAMYSATLSARVDAPASSGADPAEAVSFAADTVVGLSQTPTVLSDAAARARLPIGPTEVASRITVAPTRTAGFLSITAVAPTGTEAVLLARATSYALSVRLVRDAQTLAAATATPLRSELDQLSRQLAAPNRDPGLQERFEALNTALIEVQSRPGIGLLAEDAATLPGQPVSPAPVRDALLAFLVALIVVAECVIAVRAARGRIPEGDPAAALRSRVDRPVVVLDGGPAAVAAPLALLHHDLLADADGVVVVHLTPRRRVFDVGRALVDAHRDTDLPGGPLVEVSAAAAAGDPEATLEMPSGRPVLSLFRTSVDREVLRMARLAGFPVLIAVDTAWGRVAGVGSAVAMIRAVEVDVTAVLVWRGRQPRRSSAQPSGAPRPAGRDEARTASSGPTEDPVHTRG